MHKLNKISFGIFREDRGDSPPNFDRSFTHQLDLELFQSRRSLIDICNDKGGIRDALTFKDPSGYLTRLGRNPLRLNQLDFPVGRL